MDYTERREHGEYSQHDGLNKLVPSGFDLKPYRFGSPQRSGVMTVVPVFGPDADGRFAGPLSGLKLSKVHGYGNVELHNPGPGGVAIVPLHIGYIQDQAQNHALCRSALIAEGQKRMFDDACCVQAAQGGYLQGRDQWFFILPLQLRTEALDKRGQSGYSKIWGSISKLNRAFGLAQRGHLEQIVSRQRATLTQYRSRFELLPGQSGALFFIGDRLAGLEITPSAKYFDEVWMPLVCFCYGVAEMQAQDIRLGGRRYKGNGTGDATPRSLAIAEPFAATTLAELREQLQTSRQKWEEQVRAWLARTRVQDFTLQEEERYLSLRLHTVSGHDFAGQLVEEDGRLLYASLFARPEYMTNAK
jgi:hypothetical protein